MNHFTIAETLGPLQPQAFHDLELDGTEYVRIGKTGSWVPVKKFQGNGTFQKPNLSESSKPKQQISVPPPPDLAQNKRSSGLSAYLDIFRLFRLSLNSKSGRGKLFAMSFFYVIPGFNDMIMRGWRQDIIRRIADGTTPFLPNIGSYQQIGNYIAYGFKLSLYRLIYTIPLFVFLAIFGLEIVEIILETLLFIVFEKTSKYGNSVNQIISNATLWKLTIEGIGLLIFTFTIRPLYRIAQIRSDITLKRKYFFEWKEIKTNYQILRKNRVRVLSTFITAVGFDILAFLGIVTISAVTFGVGFFLFTPIIMAVLIYWPKAISYGLLAKKLNSSLKNVSQEMYVYGKISQDITVEDILAKQNTNFHLYEVNKDTWISHEQFISQYKAKYQEIQREKITGSIEDWKKFRQGIRQSIKRLKQHFLNDVDIIKAVVLGVAFCFPPLGHMYLRGWRLSIVQEYGRMGKILSDPVNIFVVGFKLFIARAIYFFPLGILLGFSGWQLIFFIFNLIKYIFENLISLSVSGLMGFFITELSIRIIIQLIVLGIYSLTIWPVYRLCMIRFAQSENRSLRREFFSWRRFKENFMIYRKNMREVLVHYCAAVAIDIYIPLIISLWLLVTLGIGSLALPILVPFLVLTLKYWLKGVTYGHLAYKMGFTEHERDMLA